MKSPQRQGPRPPQLLGAALLLTVILLVVAFKAFGPDPKPPGPSPTSEVATSTAVAVTTATEAGPAPSTANLTFVTGYGGGLKKNFFDDPDITRILAQKYGLSVKLIVEGSIQAMCEAGLDQVDFLWAGDQSSLSIYTGQCGGTMLGWTNIYNSPLVFYSWPDITDALIAAGVATRSGDVNTVDTAALIDLAVKGRTWASIGLPDFNGTVQIRTTDPKASNSGFLFAGLFSCALNGGRVPTTQTIDPLLPSIQTFFQNQGYMPETSASFFEQFLNQGRGAYPIAVGYESQIFEYLMQYPWMRPQVQANIRMLYPKPTVWASHPFIARTSNGQRLMNALKDPDIQALALSHHGSRPNFPISQASATPFPHSGYLDTITSACNMPAGDVMKRLLDAIATPAPSATGTPTDAVKGTPIAGANSP